MLALAPASPEYMCRRATRTPLYRLVQDHVERFAGAYDDAYASRYGVWRPRVGDVLSRYLECGILSRGFLRVRCTNRHCRDEVLVPWSCKCPGLCPSCAQRRSQEFSLFAHETVLEDVPVRHVVLTVPKVLRPTCLRERRLLRKLSACAWADVEGAVQGAVARRAQPGSVAAVATAGDLANPHPHLHAIVAAGAWVDGNFVSWPEEVTGPRLEDLFRRYVLAMLVKEERLNEATATRLGSWYPSGFSVFLGESIAPWNTESRLRLARYLLKAPVSLERMQYDRESCQVRYVSTRRPQERCLSGMDFLADLAAHIPDRGEHAVTYYGRYSNRARGMRRRQLSTPSDKTPLEVTVGPSRKAFRLAWAALLKRVWDIDVTCRKCGAAMHVIAGITKPSIVERILRHLGLWDVPHPPGRHACPTDPHPLFSQVDLVVAEDLPDPDPGWPESDAPFPED